MQFKNIMAWISQLVIAGIMIGAGWGKIIGNESNVKLFEVLGMEPTGRYIIGVIELAIVALLLVAKLSPIGALLAIATMLGASIAHLTELGINYENDNGMHVIMLSVVMICSVAILLIRKKDVPFLGRYLVEEAENRKPIKHDDPSAETAGK